MSARRTFFVIIICSLASAFAGCASGPYQFGRGWEKSQSAHKPFQDDASRLQIAEGKPNKFIDGVGWVLGIPGKLLLWDRRVDNHRIQPETTAAVAQYLEQNQLNDVCLRVNQYAPGDEWVRLTTNREVGAGWRYTLGTLSLVGYTLLPGRLLGGDHYNPYTNSVYIYSDVPALAMESAAYAKDVHRRSYPGTYAAVNELPVVSIWHDTIATDDALAYLETTSDRENQAEGLEILHPYYGSRIGGALGEVFGGGLILPVGGAIVGHISGRMQASQLPATEEVERSTASSTPVKPAIVARHDADAP